MRGRLIALIVAGFVFLVVLRCLHGFLRVDTGGNGNVLVVEGWISTRRVEQAAEAFRKGQYQIVVVARGVYRDGTKWESGRHTMDYIAADLATHGVPTNVIRAVHCPVVEKDRTYHCARSVRDFLEQENILFRSVDVATLATHSRRSRLMYEKAFGNNVSVGMIAMNDPSYNPDRWWRTSAGVRDVLGETIAYLYARLLFSPGRVADGRREPGP